MALQRHRSSATPLALAWAALVLYASLYPFTGWRWPPGQGFITLMRLPWPPWNDGFDTWSNLLGYLPLGLLLLIAARRSDWRWAPTVLLTLGLPSLLSYAAELTQTFLPGRYPSAKDWALNSAGAAAGALLGSAIHAMGWIQRWSLIRERWFVRQSAGALALLALWPMGLLFPAPAPLGLGQLGWRLREWLVEALRGVPWAEAVHALLASPPPQGSLWPPAEGAISALGMLAPCLVAFSVVPPGWRRVVLVFGALAMAGMAMTLSTLLNFGPDHALAWIAPGTGAALLAGAGVATLLASSNRRVAAALGLVALTALVMLVAQAPSDPYFAQSLRQWEQGKFVRFHGLAQWVGWLWPYAAMGWLLTRLGREG
jgi:VanZ family protein